MNLARHIVFFGSSLILTPNRIPSTMYITRTSSSLRYSKPYSFFSKSIFPNNFNLFTINPVPFSSVSSFKFDLPVIDSQLAAVSSLSQDGPVAIDLDTIDETQFDRVLAEAQQREESVIIVWIASWCRKCIYLKPKLEKLAADYYPRLRFYSVDVNKVPHALVVRAGVTKMPTIQLWQDGKKQGEVVGGHQAHLVINEVRQMIESDGDI